MRLYYIIWAAAINGAKSVKEPPFNWKISTIGYLSIFMSLNLLTIDSIIEHYIFSRDYLLTSIDFFPGDNLDAFFSAIVFYFSVPFCVNYFLVFYKEQYKNIELNYSIINGKKYLLVYIVLSVIFSLYRVVL